MTQLEFFTHKFTHRERLLQSLSATWQPPRECKSLIRRACLDCRGRGRGFESRRPRHIFKNIQMVLRESIAQSLHTKISFSKILPPKWWQGWEYDKRREEYPQTDEQNASRFGLPRPTSVGFIGDAARLFNGSPDAMLGQAIL